MKLIRYLPLLQRVINYLKITKSKVIIWCMKCFAIKIMLVSSKQDSTYIYLKDFELCESLFQNNNVIM